VAAQIALIFPPNPNPLRRQVIEDRSFVLRIEAQHREMSRDPAAIHNRDLHARILRTWERDSPKMWARLTKLGIASKLAFVLQERMWRERDRLAEAGMQLGDAGAIAMAEKLMLAPEADEEAAEEETEA
jgi:hypothetical protein